MSDSVIIQGIVGVQNNGDGILGVPRLGRQGELQSSQVHARFYEQNYRGNLYSLGISNTAATSLNAIATGLTATATPIVGAYNPPTSNVNLVLLKASVILTTLSDAAVSPGGFMWCFGVGQTITTGLVPYNQKTLTKSGAQGQAFTMTTVMTGLSGSVVAGRGSSIAPFNAAGAATAVSVVCGGVEDIDGSIIVPPGGVAGLFAQVSSTTYKATVAILWEEVPV